MQCCCYKKNARKALKETVSFDIKQSLRYHSDYMNSLEKHNFDLENSMDIEYLNPKYKTNKVTPEGKSKIDKILKGSSS